MKSICRKTSRGLVDCLENIEQEYPPSGFASCADAAQRHEPFSANLFTNKSKRGYELILRRQSHRVPRRSHWRQLFHPGDNTIQPFTTIRQQRVVLWAAISGHSVIRPRFFHFPRRALRSLQLSTVYSLVSMPHPRWHPSLKERSRCRPR